MKTTNSNSLNLDTMFAASTALLNSRQLKLHNCGSHSYCNCDFNMGDLSNNRYKVSTPSNQLKKSRSKNKSINNMQAKASKNKTPCKPPNNLGIANNRQKQRSKPKTIGRSGSKPAGNSTNIDFQNFNDNFTKIMGSYKPAHNRTNSNLLQLNNTRKSNGSGFNANHSYHKASGKQGQQQKQVHRQKQRQKEKERQKQSREQKQAFIYGYSQKRNKIWQKKQKQISRQMANSSLQNLEVKHISNQQNQHQNQGSQYKLNCHDIEDFQGQTQGYMDGINRSRVNIDVDADTDQREYELDVNRNVDKDSNTNYQQIGQDLEELEQQNVNTFRKSMRPSNVGNNKHNHYISISSSHMFDSDMLIQKSRYLSKSKNQSTNLPSSKIQIQKTKQRHQNTEKSSQIKTLIEYNQNRSEQIPYQKIIDRTYRLLDWYKAHCVALEQQCGFYRGEWQRVKQRLEKLEGKNLGARQDRNRVYGKGKTDVRASCRSWSRNTVVSKKSYVNINQSSTIRNNKTTKRIQLKNTYKLSTNAQKQFEREKSQSKKKLNKEKSSIKNKNKSTLRKSKNMAQNKCNNTTSKKNYSFQKITNLLHRSMDLLQDPDQIMNNNINKDKDMAQQQKYQKQSTQDPQQIRPQTLDLVQSKSLSPCHSKNASALVSRQSFLDQENFIELNLMMIDNGGCKIITRVGQNNSQIEKNDVRQILQYYDDHL